MSPISLQRFGERLVASLRPAARDANLYLHLAADDGEVVTDARLLEMIASNLLSNAIRYTPSGGSVQFELRRHDSEPLLRARDTGVGIPPEHQKRIFERLYRVDSTRDRATGGSGLGLAIVASCSPNPRRPCRTRQHPGSGQRIPSHIPRPWLARTARG